MRQSTLFEDDAPIDDELLSLASKIPNGLRFGTSSWTFPGWKGIVYHREYETEKAFRRSSLAEYARYPLFGTVGIDRSFYRPLSAGELESYAAQLPEGFRCIEKVPREIVSPILGEERGDGWGKANPRFLDSELFEDIVVSQHRGKIRDHLDAFLFQIPPTHRRLPPRLFEPLVARFLDRAPGDLRYAFEIRSPELLTPRYLDILKHHGASPVLNYWSDMPSLGEQLDRVGIDSLPFVVCRLLLPPGTRYGDRRDHLAPFDRLVDRRPEMRADVQRLIAAALDRNVELSILVNNKAEGSSPLTVRELAEALTSLDEP